MEKPKEEFSLFGYYYGIDLTYIVLVLPAILLGLWAQMRVKSTYARYSQVRASRGVTADQAARGYKEINYRAMKLLPRGGYLATCSCSHFMTAGLFLQMLREAAADAGVRLRQIEERRQAPDHPILWGVPETEYLKFLLFQVA